MEPPEPQDMLRRRGAFVAQDVPQCLPLTSTLVEGDLLYLLTPAAIPVELPIPGSQAQDPFEPFGKALAKYHPWVRHIPYVPRDGITQYHERHLSLAKAVIFVITGPPREGQPSQVGLSQVVRKLAPDQLHIVFVCCSLSLLGPCDGFFPTLIEAKDYSVGSLECAADIIFSAPASRSAEPAPAIEPAHAMASNYTQYLVEEWEPNRDLVGIQDLWCKSLPVAFHLDRFRLGELLYREGFMRHFVVYDRMTRQLLAFCATYTTFANSDGTKWAACLAALLVQPTHRRRGIGSALYHHVAAKLLESDKVLRFQLGCSFPHLLLGPIAGTDAEHFFRHLGWQIDASGPPGTGQVASDWVLDLSDWRAAGLSDGGLTFVQCLEGDIALFNEALNFAESESVRSDSINNIHFYDLYKAAKEILLVFEGSEIVASAASYVCGQGSQLEAHMPWPSTISTSAGGLSCICIAEDRLSPNHTRDSVIIRLINYGVHILGSQGVKMMFLDSIRGGEEGFQSVDVDVARSHWETDGRPDVFKQFGVATQCNGDF